MKKIIKNSLGYDSNLFIYQDKEMFNYSVDTILLGNFATINSKVKNVLEVGTNNGALSIFLSERSSKLKIDAIEIQKEAIELAKINLKENKKENNINLIHEDFNKFKNNKANFKKYDLVICNPPFYKINIGFKRNGNEKLHIATHEIKINLEDIIHGSSCLLKQKGYLALIEPTERLVDMFVLLRKYNFEPKRVQLIFPREDKKSNLVLVESRYRAGWGTHFLPNIYLHPNDSDKHVYREEVIKLYKPLKEKNDE